jgi:hypothetical protein
MATATAKMISTLPEKDATEIMGSIVNSLGTFDIPKAIIKLDEYKLRELWCKGIINDISYVTFALELESKAAFNIDSFARKWENVELSGEQLNDGWKSKKLKVRAILNVIGILDEKGLGCCDFNVKVSQLSLFE